MKEGWSASLIEGHENLRVFSAPEMAGHVTVDYEKRGWRFGISYYGLTRPSKKYVGRGWRERIEEDAMNDLASVLKAPSAASHAEESK